MNVGHFQMTYPKLLTSTLDCGHLPRDEHLYFNVVLRRLGH